MPQAKDQQFTNYKTSSSGTKAVEIFYKASQLRKTNPEGATISILQKDNF
jgi:hypothetical protein